MNMERMTFINFILIKIKTIIIAILIGTLLADNLMWYSIKLSSKKNLPIIITLIHSVPILSFIIVYLFYRAVIGIIISVIGSSIAVFYSEKI